MGFEKIALYSKKVSNTIRCQYHYFLSLFGIIRTNHYPTFITIEPANSCQLACPECPIGIRKQAKNGRAEEETTTKAIQKFAPIDPPSFEEMVAKAQPKEKHRIYFENYDFLRSSPSLDYANVVQFYFQGEPLLHKDLEKMVAIVKKRGCITIVSTNAQALTKERAERLVESGLDRLIVSIDGITQSTYEAYRKGGDLGKAIKAMQYVQEAKRRLNKRLPIVEMQCLRLKSNEGEWQEIQKTYRTMGADVLRFKTAQLYDYEHGNDLMPSNDRFARYTQQSDGRYTIKRRLWRRLWEKIMTISPCKRLWQGCVISTNGEVLPCCYDKDKRYTWGNIYEQDLKTIFQSEKANRFREKAIQNAQSIPICQNCWH